jgi:hypothetical protein
MRLLIETHSLCSEQLKAIEQIGQANRQSEETKNQVCISRVPLSRIYACAIQVEIEAQKSTDTNLERLVTDYCELKQSNDVMQMKLDKL